MSYSELEYVLKPINRTIKIYLVYEEATTTAKR